MLAFIEHAWDWLRQNKDALQAISALLAILGALWGVLRFAKKVGGRGENRLPRSPETRVSFAALLRICDGDRYLLIRNKYRSEVMAPLGGVFKYQESATAKLDSLAFRPELRSDLQDSRGDMRGVIPTARLKDFIGWFNKGVDRENAKECLTRELAEEIEEVGLQELLSVPDDLEFRLVRKISEPIARDPGYTWDQFRHFEVYEPILTNEVVKCFFDALKRSAPTNPNLEFATAEQIIRGRTPRGAVIGHHCAYLYGEESVRHPSPAPVS